MSSTVHFSGDCIILWGRCSPFVAGALTDTFTSAKQVAVKTRDCFFRALLPLK